MHIDNVIFLILSKNAYTKFSAGPIISSFLALDLLARCFKNTSITVDVSLSMAIIPTIPANLCTISFMKATRVATFSSCLLLKKQLKNLLNKSHIPSWRVLIEYSLFLVLLMLNSSGFSPGPHRACDFHRTRRSIDNLFLCAGFHLTIIPAPFLIFSVSYLVFASVKAVRNLPIFSLRFALPVNS